MKDDYYKHKCEKHCCTHSWLTLAVFVACIIVAAWSVFA